MSLFCLSVYQEKCNAKVIVFELAFCKKFHLKKVKIKFNGESICLILNAWFKGQ